MNQEQADKILRDQTERERVKQEREALVEKVIYSINKDQLPKDYKNRVLQESEVILDLIETIILNCEHGRGSRHQYADGHGSLAGVSLSLEDIDVALIVVRKIRGI